jgi:hypothetical protein
VVEAVAVTVPAKPELMIAGPLEIKGLNLPAAGVVPPIVVASIMPPLMSTFS